MLFVEMVFRLLLIVSSNTASLFVSSKNAPFYAFIKN